MHINMKYYVVSMGSIFISLGVGMLIGFNLNYDQELSKQQTQIINDLDVRFEKLKETNDNLDTKLKELNLSYNETIDFINSNLDKLISGELLNQSIGIISTSEDVNIDYIEETIEKADGNISFNISFTDKITDESLLVSLLEKNEIKIKNKEEFITYVLDALKDEGAQEKLQILQDLGILNIKSLESNYMNTASIVLNGHGDVEKFESLDKILIDKLKAEEKHIVAVETTDAESSLIELYSENKITTVNNINQDNGQLALVLTLKDKLLVGDFGVGDNCKSLIPYK